MKGGERVGGINSSNISNSCYSASGLLLDTETFSRSYDRLCQGIPQDNNNKRSKRFYKRI